MILILYITLIANIGLNTAKSYIIYSSVPLCGSVVKLIQSSLLHYNEIDSCICFYLIFIYLIVVAVCRNNDCHTPSPWHTCDPPALTASHRLNSQPSSRSVCGPMALGACCQLQGGATFLFLTINILTN